MTTATRNLHIRWVFWMVCVPSTCVFFFFSLLVHFFTVLCETTGSLSKGDLVNSEDVVQKCDFALLHLFLDYSMSVIWLAKCLPTIRELNCWERFGDGKKQKLKSSRQLEVLMLSPQLQSRWFCVVDWTRRAAKFTEMKNARAKLSKLLFFHC